MESSQVKGLFIIVLSAMFAVYLGVAAATASFEAIAWVAGFAALAFILALGKHIWVLIPMGLVLQGTINAVPGSPPAWALAGALVAVMFLVRFAMRVQDFGYRFDLLDAAILLQVVMVGQAYVRNPTGLLIFGGTVAGGKPYFVFAAAFLCFFLLALVKPDTKVFKWTVITMIAVAIGDGLIATISDYSPRFAMAVLKLYSNANYVVANTQDAARDLSVSRGGGGVALLGRAMVIPCFCLMRPIKAISPFRPLIMLTVAIGTVLVLYSGFRSGIAYLGAVFIASALIRRKMIDVVAASLMGLTCLLLIVVSGKARSLPFGVQRVLSVLPIEVSAAARMDAENSSEWRFEMWKLALTTDRYIQDKVWGDGFGFSAVEIRAMLDSEDGYSDAMTNIQDQMLAKGSYHGFHVETIRFTGVMGLLAALFFMIVCFRKALQLIRSCRGHPLFPYVAYACIPFIIYPFWAMLVFGSYRLDFPMMMAMAGMLKMMDKLKSEWALAPEVQELPAPRQPMGLPVPAGAGAMSAAAANAPGRHA